jgi:hypothetical protein
MKAKTKISAKQKQLWRQAALEEMFLDLEESNPSASQWTGLQDAIIGIASRFGQPDLICYDFEKMVQILMRRDKMSRDEAVEFLDFNTLGCWSGAGTPVVLHRI